MKFRLSNHKLKIETGRHTKTPIDERTCDLCDNKDIEDEQHFLIHCPFYNKERKNLFIIAKKYNADFNILTDKCKFKFIMENDNISMPLAKYIVKCMETRHENSS